MSWRSQSSWSAKRSASVSGRQHAAKMAITAGAVPRRRGRHGCGELGVVLGQGGDGQPALVAEPLHQRRRRDAGRLRHLGRA